MCQVEIWVSQEDVGGDPRSSFATDLSDCVLHCKSPAAQDPHCRTRSSGHKSNDGQTGAKADGDGARGQPGKIQNPSWRHGELAKLSMGRTQLNHSENEVVSVQWSSICATRPYHENVPDATCSPWGLVLVATGSADEPPLHAVQDGISVPMLSSGSALRATDPKQPGVLWVMPSIMAAAIVGCLSLAISKQSCPTSPVGCFTDPLGGPQSHSSHREVQRSIHNEIRVHHIDLENVGVATPEVLVVALCQETCQFKLDCPQPIVCSGSGAVQQQQPSSLHSRVPCVHLPSAPVATRCTWCGATGTPKTVNPCFDSGSSRSPRHTTAYGFMR